jgi:tetratricopeptide (TPR) repeat protein
MLYSSGFVSACAGVARFLSRALVCLTRPARSLRSSFLVAIATLAVSAFSAPRSDAAEAAKPLAPLFEDIGRHHHPITTRSPQAQRYFDQGMMLIFNFNHKEAVRSFRAAATLDPECAMAHWGEAFAQGPHINGPMTDEAVPLAWAALQRAQQLKAKANPRERAYIEALAKRYSAPGAKHDRAALDRAFALAMRGVADAFPDDHDAAVFWVDAWMNTTPWNYWQADKRTPKPDTAEAIRAIEKVMMRIPDHPGANHIYIHLVEAGPAPERALPSASRLRRYAPAAGHLVHMPSHIYIRVGQYQDAVEANEEAARADRSYIAACQVQGFYPGVYYPHNMHFLWYALMFQGRAGRSLDAAKEVAAYASSPLCGTTVAEKPRLTWLPIVTHLRFGAWDKVLATPEPVAEAAFDRAIWRFARARAFAAKRDAAGAAREAAALETLAASDAVKAVDSPIFPANQVLVVARHLAQAGVAEARRENERMVSLLREAVKAEHQLPYMEPAFWVYPTRQTLGATLLRLGRAAEAEAEFRADLAEFPRNGWSLFGLAEALRAQGKSDAAAMVNREFATAWDKSDVKLTLEML